MKTLCLYLRWSDCCACRRLCTIGKDESDPADGVEDGVGDAYFALPEGAGAWAGSDEAGPALGERDRRCKAAGWTSKQSCS